MKIYYTPILAMAISASSAFAAESYKEIDSIAFNSGASQIAYASAYDTLAIRNSGSAITLIDLNSGTQKSTHFSNSQFTDMDISPDGRYLFAADYGRENTGYGTPSNQSYVHRYDLSSGKWDVQSTKNIAGSIEAVTGDKFILASKDQWISFSYEAIGPGSSTAILQSQNSFNSGVYTGDIEYDAAHYRLLHGDSGSSSSEITAFRLSNNEFSKQDSSGTYGSAQGYGGSVILANDASSLYYGRLQVDALDVTHNRNVFGEIIHGATGDTAFGETQYFDAQTGALLGDYGFKATVMAVNPNGNDIWVVDNTGHRLVHLAPVPEPKEYALMHAGIGLLSLVLRQRKTKLKV
jgi:predicted secreted protein